MSYSELSSDGFTVSSNVEPEAQLRANLTPDAVETPVVETPEPIADPEPDPTETPEPVKAAADRNPDGTFKTKPKKGSLDRLIWEREEAERKTTAAEQRALAAENALAQARQPKAEPEPTPKLATSQGFAPYDDYMKAHPDASYEDYLDARAEYRIEQKLAARDAEATVQRGRIEFETLIAAHAARVEAVKTTKADYQAVMDAGDAALRAAGVQLPEAFLRGVLSSERSADILYDLASHPEIAIQLAREASTLPPTAAPVMRRLLESRLTAAPVGSAGSASHVSSAKPLIQPVRSSPTAADDAAPDDAAPFDVHKKYWDSKERAGARR